MQGQAAWGPVPVAPAVSVPPPARAAVAVIGGGYTGLACARAVARAGGDVVLLEREGIGHGASSRNAGFVLPGFQAGIGTLLRLAGPEGARELFQDSLDAVTLVERLTAEEGIACGWHRPGYLYLAAKPRHLAHLEAEQQALRRHLGYETVLLDRAALRRELGSDQYHGALLEPLAGTLDPRRYLEGLAAAARRAGASLHEGVEVRAIRRAGAGYQLETPAGTVQADQVVVATNGYTGRLHSWVTRRVVSVGSFMVATAPLPPALRQQLFPTGRCCADTRRLLRYFRLTDDGRLLFGGRAAFLPGAVERSVALLQQELRAVFPALAEVPVEHGWGGRLAVPVTGLPHLGRTPDGVHYALGYAGHGVANATWLGDRLGRVLAGQAEWPRLARLPFPAIPFHAGTPWFLPFVGAYYRMYDWLR